MQGFAPWPYLVSPLAHGVCLFMSIPIWGAHGRSVTNLLRQQLSVYGDTYTSATLSLWSR